MRHSSQAQGTATARRYRLLRWIAFSVLSLVALAVIAAVAGPALLDLPAVQARLEQKLSEAAHGQLEWDELEVHLLPAPHGVMRKAHIHIPDVVDGTVEELEVALRLVPLFAGRVELQELLIVRPVVKVKVPASGESASTEPLDPIAAYRRALEPVVPVLQRFASDLTVKVQEGSIDADIPGPRNIERVQFNAEVGFDRSGVDLSASSSSDTWDGLKTRAHLNYSDLSAEVQIDAVGFKPQGLIDDFVPSTVARLLVPTGSASAKLSTDGRTNLDVEIVLDVPAASIERNGTRFGIHGGRAEASATLAGRRFEVNLKTLRLGEVLPLGAARVRFDPASQPAAELTIDVPAIDLTRLRGMALTLAADEPLVRDYVGRIHGGQATDLRVTARGTSLAELADASAIDVSIKLADGAMKVPYLEREVEGIAGEVAWRDGAVSARSIAGRLGGTRVSNGTFDYTLASGRMHIGTAYDLDLAQALEVARSLPDTPAPLREVLRSARGRAAGALQIGLDAGQFSVDISVTRSDSSVMFAKVPWPVTLREGRIVRTSTLFSVIGASGALGESSFRGVTIEMPSTAPVRIKTGRGSASLALRQLYPWLRAQPALAGQLERVPTAAGQLDATLNHLSVNVDKLETLDFDVTLSPHQLQVEVTDLPGPLRLDGGSVRITPSALRFDAFGVGMLDAKARIGGTVADYRAQSRKVDASATQGEIGDRFVAWAWEHFEAPPRLRPKTPIQFAAQRVRWSAQEGIDLQATAQPEAAASLEVDLAWNDGMLDLRSLHIKDQESDATSGLTMRGRLLDVRFKGLLTGASANRLFAKSVGGRRSRTQGDFHATLDRDLRGRSYGEGTLTGEQISLYRLLGVPAWIDRISLRGDGKTLYVEEATFAYAKQKVTLRGNIYRGPSGPVINAEIDTPGVVIDELLPKKTAPPAGDEEPQEPRGWEVPEALEIWPLPLEGKVAVHAGFVEYSGYRVEPLAGTLAVQPGKIDLTLTQAKLCGIEFPFQLQLDPQGAAIAAQLTAQDQQLEETAKCMTEQRVLVTGRFDMRADLRTRGKTSELLRNLEGSVQLRARKGKVMKFALIGNILSIKSITSVLKGKVSLGAEGFDYKKMGWRGTIEKGVVRVDEAAFDSNAVGLAATGTVNLDTRTTNLTVLVAPFTTWDRLVRAIPVFGYIIGGTLSSIPVKVTGDIRDPTVIPLDPRAVTGELVGIFQRTLDLPKKLIDSLTPATPPANGAPQK